MENSNIFLKLINFLILVIKFMLLLSFKVFKLGIKLKKEIYLGLK